MTVGSLIEQLKAIPPELEVYVEDWECEVGKIEGVATGEIFTGWVDVWVGDRIVGRNRTAKKVCIIQNH